MIKSYDISSDFYEFDSEEVGDMVLAYAVRDEYIKDAEKQLYEVLIVEN